MNFRNFEKKNWFGLAIAWIFGFILLIHSLTNTFLLARNVGFELGENPRVIYRRALSIEDSFTSVISQLDELCSGERGTGMMKPRRTNLQIMAEIQVLMQVTISYRRD